MIENRFCNKYTNPKRHFKLDGIAIKRYFGHS
nr:MAG TPA: hypothetical protein [Caudoviricetes sp.]